MRIRRAGDDDLLTVAGIFATTAEWLARRYQPHLLPQFPLDPADRLPMYRHLLSTGAMFVADDPAPVGYAAAFVRDQVWFLSQLWVVPERHGEGIGARLLDEALAWGRGARTFSTVASPHPGAQTLYLRRSMFPVWPLLELSGRPRAGRAAAPTTVPIADADAGWIDDLDRQVRGVARPEDHAMWMREANGLVLHGPAGRIGYVYASEAGRIGPGAAYRAADVPALLHAGCAIAAGDVRISIPGSNWAALNEALALGLRVTSLSTFLSSRSMPDGTRYVSSGGALG